VKHSTGSILFVTRCDYLGKQVFFNDRVREFDYSLVKETGQARIGLVKALIEPEWKPAVASAAIDRLLKNHTLLGAIIWKDCFPPNLFAALVEKCLSAGMPVAVIDELGDYHSSMPLERKAPVIALTIAAYKAGRDIGQYLLNKGHRKAAYVTINRSSLWSKRRGQGLADTFVNAGIAEGVNVYGDDFLPGPGDLAEIGFVKKRDSIAQDLLRISKAIPRFSISLQTIDTYSTLSALFYQETIYRHIKPWLEQIARSGDISAMVCATDQIGILALDHLSSIRLKRPIWVIGFDDIRMAQEYGLSSYNFNLSSIARDAVNCILNPGHERWKGSGVVESEGVIMERGSKG
jgi:DNA-binding LacI/PurR family transcriptional regulator